VSLLAGHGIEAWVAGTVEASGIADRHDDGVDDGADNGGRVTLHGDYR
jgi:hypothetical protein